MKKILIAIGAVIVVLALGMVGWIQTGSNVRLLREPGSLKPTGKTERTRDPNALDYSVAISIAAPPAVVWGLLTDGPGFTGWNTTVVKLEGAIASGSELKLTAKIAPERVFPL